MQRIVVSGWATVSIEGEPISEPAVLRSLDGLVYDDERFTDYLGGPPEENAVAAVLEPGGHLRFSYVEGQELLRVTTQYRSRRPLTSSELQLVLDYTLGQWSDGIGENWTCESGERCGYTIMCLAGGDENASASIDIDGA